jgi:hypothetical protein
MSFTNLVNKAKKIVKVSKHANGKIKRTEAQTRKAKKALFGGGRKS